jgi:hypothetical protein
MRRGIIARPLVPSRIRRCDKPDYHVPRGEPRGMETPAGKFVWVMQESNARASHSEIERRIAFE